MCYNKQYLFCIIFDNYIFPTEENFVASFSSIAKHLLPLCGMPMALSLPITNSSTHFWWFFTDQASFKLKISKLAIINNAYFPDIKCKMNLFHQVSDNFAFDHKVICRGEHCWCYGRKKSGIFLVHIDQTDAVIWRVNNRALGKSL